MRERKSIFHNIDLATILLYVIIVLFGWINIYAAEYSEVSGNIFDVNQRYGKQFIWIIAASLLAFFILITDSKFYFAFSYIIFLLSIISLIIMLIAGTTISGSKSWFQIGNFGIQPAEFAKFATALALAKYLSSLNISLSKFKCLLIATLIIITPAFLIFLQNDTGTTLVFFALLLVLFREGASSKVLIFAFGIVFLFILTLLFNKFILILSLFAFMIMTLFFIRSTKRNIISLLLVFTLSLGYIFSADYAFENLLKPHQKNRINVLIGKEIDLKGSGYNVHQSKIAIGSGGLSGKGFLKGTQTKYNFVPEQSTDFIFCTVGEEWGFVGSMFVITIFITLLFRLIKLAERQRSVFSRIYGYCVASVIFFHFSVNIGMTIGIVPVIGIPLPFFSYGGSSLWAFTILLFIFIRLDASRLEVL